MTSFRRLYTIYIELVSETMGQGKKCCSCSVTQACSSHSDSMDCSTPAFPVFHYLPECSQIHVHWVCDAIQHLMFCCPLPFLPSIFPSIRAVYPALGSLPEKAMAPHSSTLAWKILWAAEPGRLRSMGSLRVGHDWATSLSLFTFTHWRRKWQPTPVFLPGESQGQGSLVGCRLWGHTESDTTEAT